MLAVVTERGDVGVMRAMALAIAAAIAAAAKLIWLKNKKISQREVWKFGDWQWVAGENGFEQNSEPYMTQTPKVYSGDEEGFDHNPEPYFNVENVTR